MICWDELLCLLPTNHPLEHLPHRPAGRTLGSRDIRAVTRKASARSVPG